MLKVISCHGRRHGDQGSPHDFLCIIKVYKEEQKNRPLTAKEILTLADGEIASLSCYGEDISLSALADKLFSVIKPTEGEANALTLLRRLMEGAIGLSHQPRDQVKQPETASSGHGQPSPPFAYRATSLPLA
jgi:hypothetical protein